MTKIEDFIEQNGPLFRQEELILEVTELLSKIMSDKKVIKTELAKRLNKSKAFVTQCLTGSQNLTLRTLSDLFTALESQLQVGAVSLSAGASKSVHRLYPVGAWSFEKQCADDDAIIDCSAAATHFEEVELCDVA